MNQDKLSWSKKKHKGNYIHDGTNYAVLIYLLIHLFIESNVKKVLVGISHQYNFYYSFYYNNNYYYYYFPGPALVSSETDQGALEQATGRVLGLWITEPCTEGYC